MSPALFISACCELNMRYLPNMLVSKCQTFVSLFHIESIKLNNVFNHTEQSTIDKLKNDITLTVGTIGGQFYEVSVVDQGDYFPNYKNPKLSAEDIVNDVLNRWNKIIETRKL